MRPGGTVLVVDDDEELLETLHDVLSSAGYAVRLARNGAEALAAARSAAPELILLDLNMPVMDGVAFRRQQLATPALSGIPTVAMSALDRLAQRLEGVPMTALLPKPFSLQKLLELVERTGSA